MRWYFQIRGGHTHVRVFMNGALCGTLCFRNEEFSLVREKHEGLHFTLFIDETPVTKEK